MDPLAYYADKIAQLKPELKTKYFVQSIGLFGSVVRQDFSETTSDLDVLVDFSVPVGIEFIQLADYLEKALNFRVDLVSKNGVKPDYMRIIESEVVYV
jgi:hypothetical protein